MKTQNVEQEVILKKDKEIKKLKKDLDSEGTIVAELAEANKILLGSVNMFEIELKRLKTQNKKDMKYIKELRKELELKTEVKKVIEMPFVHVRVNKVLSGKFPKTDITISAGGALEQINFDDVGSFTDSMVDKIALEMADAIKKLDPIQ